MAEALAPPPAVPLQAFLLQNGLLNGHGPRCPCNPRSRTAAATIPRHRGRAAPAAPAAPAAAITQRAKAGAKAEDAASHAAIAATPPPHAKRRRAAAGDEASGGAKQARGRIRLPAAPPSALKTPGGGRKGRTQARTPGSVMWADDAHSPPPSRARLHKMARAMNDASSDD